MQRIKQSETKQYREKEWRKQHGICPLCQQYINPVDAVLDHCHKTGYIRKVLHRSCNSLLGKFENALQRFAIDDHRAKFIAENMLTYARTLSDTLHYTFKTPEEKQALIKKRKERAKKNKK